MSTFDVEIICCHSLGEGKENLRAEVGISSLAM
jgi:hypothetical protein